MNIRLVNYDKIVLSISGGKDSQAMTEIMVRQAIKDSLSDRIVLVYADTGAEWKESKIQCQLIAQKYDLPLLVKEAYRPLPQHIQRRGKWPSMACRYCTSDCKRSTIDKVVRTFSDNILVVTGERREESKPRSLLQESGPISRLNTQTRKVTSFRPMLDCTEEDIWRIIKESNITPHPAYEYGNKRVSCVLCVLASKNDLRVGAAHYPELADMYMIMECDMKHSFRVNSTLRDILR